MRRVLPLVLAALVLLPPLAAAAYPDPGAVPTYHDSRCFEEFDRRFVHDYLGLMQADHARGLEGAACEVYAKTHAHFVLVTVEDTDGEILENYALHLFETWGIGQRDVNDGLLLLYVRDYAVQGGGGAVRVEVGYGLEGVVNARVAMDAVRLMQQAKQQALDAGRGEEAALSFALAAGSEHLLATLDAEYVDGSFPPPEPRGGPTFGFTVGVWILLVVFVLVLAAASRSRRGWGYRGHRDQWDTGLGAYFAASILDQMMRRGGGGGGLGGGGFGGGGLGGGGGGFGGGRSGGGGGSGRL